MQDNNIGRYDFARISGKLVVTAVRGVDHAHPGEEKLIDIVLGKIPKNLERRILDVGSGLGGPAFYMQENRWGLVSGIDMDEASIAYAKKTYPACEFFLGDVLATSRILEKRTFDLITIFSAFYAFPDQAGALAELCKMVAKGEALVIYDYTDLTNGKNPYKRIGKRVANCIPGEAAKFAELLKTAGWELVAHVNMDALTETWYAELLVKFDEKRERLLKIFPEDVYQGWHNDYIRMYNAFKEKILGASVFYARKM